MGVTQNVNVFVSVTGGEAAFQSSGWQVGLSPLNPVGLPNGLVDVTIGTATNATGVFAGTQLNGGAQDVSGAGGLVFPSTIEVQNSSFFPTAVPGDGSYGLFALPVTFNEAGSFDLVIEPDATFTQFFTNSATSLGALPTLTLTATAVPEPSTWALCGVVFACLGCSVMRRCRKCRAVEAKA
ncbi:MAG: PEP-CTERM sorting domain-containing protein [Planctomycetaceae bacterium]